MRQVHGGATNANESRRLKPVGQLAALGALAVVLAGCGSSSVQRTPEDIARHVVADAKSGDYTDLCNYYEPSQKASCMSEQKSAEAGENKSDLAKMKVTAGPPVITGNKAVIQITSAEHGATMNLPAVLQKQGSTWYLTPDGAF